ncbi:MAG: aldehyde dehydrogenase family protein [Pseudorhodoplanes sp.]
MIEAKLFIDGAWIAGESQSELKDKFTGQTIAKVHNASEAQVDEAVAAARRVFDASRIPIPERYDILMRAKDILVRRKEEILDLMVAETGFTRADNAGDFGRCVQTLLTSAEEAKRITGEMVPIDSAPGHEGELAFTIRVPLGVVACITPFNSPLNTTAHKIAPAIAAGNAVVVKPASYTPLSAMILTEILIEAGLPKGWVNLVNGPGGATGAALCANPDVRYFAFTGGGPAGEAIQRAAGLRRTQMELGNISATIICDDANLKVAAAKSSGTAFRKAGQVCTSLQRLFVHSSVVKEFGRLLAENASAMKVGDPRDPKTAIGPMISVSEAERVEAWIAEAKKAGAKVLLGGTRNAGTVTPTILDQVTTQMRVVSEEIFGPVVSLIPFDDLDDAIEQVNATPYGLSAGIFTRNIDTAFRAARRIEVGLFNINNTSSNRADLMPYGGVKMSGFGREGPRAAIRDMTDERLITITPA